MASQSNAGDSENTAANTASSLTVASEPKRKVSILAEPTGTSGHDNPAFEGETRSRKTSQVRFIHVITREVITTSKAKSTYKTFLSPPRFQVNLMVE